MKQSVLAIACLIFNVSTFAQDFNQLDLFIIQDTSEGILTPSLDSQNANQYKESNRFSQTSAKSTSYIPNFYSRDGQAVSKISLDSEGEKLPKANSLDSQDDKFVVDEIKIISGGLPNNIYQNYGGCIPDNLILSQGGCADNGGGVLPIINMSFEILGPCLVQNIFWQIDGGGYTSADILALGLNIGNGDGLNFVNTLPDAIYEIYFQLDDGSTSAVFTWVNGNCEGGSCTADNMNISQEPCQDSGSGLLPVFNMEFEITGGCLVENIYWQVDGGGYVFGNLPAAGFFIGDGESINLTNTEADAVYTIYYELEDGTFSEIYTWNNGNCTGTGCIANNLILSQDDCGDYNGDGVLPVINMVFQITGGCLVENIFWQVDGGGYTSGNLPSAGLVIGDGDALILTSTVPGAFYEIYYELDDGTFSLIYSWVNGDCEGGSCTADNLVFEQSPCEDLGEGLLPVVTLTFGVTGGCLVENVYWQVDGGGYVSQNLFDTALFIGDGESVDLINTSPDSVYEFYYQLDDGTYSSVYTWVNGNCESSSCTADNLILEQNGCADVGLGILPAILMTFEITGDCTVENLFIQQNGAGYQIINLPASGIVLGAGEDLNLVNTTPDTFYEFYFELDDGSLSSIYSWDNGNCEGGACTADDLILQNISCQDDGSGLLPIIELTFGISGGCSVENLYWQSDSAGYVFANFPDNDLVIGDGEGINLTNTSPDAIYNFYFELDDGTYSDVFTYTNGNCNDILGCVDSSACNYDSLATIDDGSCILPDGCDDPVACNYDSLALCDDGTCEYAPCVTCIGDANGDGQVNIIDLVTVSSNFGCTEDCIGNGDANFDGVINILDLLAVSSNFGSECE